MISKTKLTETSTNNINSNINKARLQLIISMAIFGTLAIFVRNISVSSGELALYRAVLAAILIGGYLLITSKKEKNLDRNIEKEENSSIQENTKNTNLLFGICTKKELFLLLFSGMAMGFNWILLFEAYKYTSVSAATLSYYFAPIIVTVVCPFLFHEKLTGKQILCFVMSTLGVFLITGIPDFQNMGRDTIGILFGLSAAVFYATVILLNKFIKNVAGIHRTFLQFLAAVVTLIPYVAATGGFHLSTLDAKGWINLLIVGLIHTGITYCLYFSSLKELPGQEAAILSYVDPLMAVVISVAILGESISLPQIIGGILILGFAIWNEKE